ncbi:MAG: hypothetical protein ACRCTQ_05195 [Brevinemataceae bacterium]
MSALINGKFFDWGDITISLLPLSPVLFSAKEISYSEEMEAEAIYGRGRAPIGFGRGNWKASGSLSLLKSEFEALALATPNGILNLDPRVVIINIVYSNMFEGTTPLSTDTLTGIRFTKISDKAAQNDKSIYTSLDFTVFGNILRNGRGARGIAGIFGS